MRSHKKLGFQTLKEEPGEDRISTLPDDVISRILSLLPTKTSVSTTILSHRWLNLFASVPVLNFEDSLDDRDPSDSSSFTCFVTNVLCKVMAKIAHIRKFLLNCRRTYSDSVVGAWIHAATIGNLEYLDVSVNLIKPGPLPGRVLTCRTLVDLKLDGNFCLYVPDDVFLPCLKTVYLVKVIMVDDDRVRRFFSGCRVLEYLYVSECVLDDIVVFEVSISSLKWLHVCDMNGLYELSLNTPRLEFFYCSSYAAEGYSGDTLSSLKKAEISFARNKDQFMEVELFGLVNLMSQTRSLTLDNDSMKCLVYSNYPLPTFHNLTELKVSSYKAGGWEFLADILDNAPCLEVLTFFRGLLDGRGNLVKLSYFLPEWVPSCISLHLKEVKFGIFQGVEEEYKMVEYFLKNAMVLEKMTISPSMAIGPDSIDCPYLSMKQQFPTTKRLLKIPRSSRACRIVFTDGNEWELWIQEKSVNIV